MKKFIALFLTLALLLCSVSAVAESADPTFTADVDTLASSIVTAYTMQYPDSEPVLSTGDGYTLITGDNMMPIYLIQNEAGEVTLVSCLFNGSIAEFSTLGNDLGVACAVAPMGVYMAENTDMNGLLTALGTFEDDLTAVLSCMINGASYTGEELAAGVSSTGTLMSYPAGVYYQAISLEDGSVGVEMVFMLAPQSAVLE